MLNNINDIIKRQDEFNNNLGDDMEKFTLSLENKESIYGEKYSEFIISNNGYDKRYVVITKPLNLYDLITKIIFVFKPYYYISGKYPIMNKLLDTLCINDKVHPIYNLMINKSLSFKDQTYKKYLYDNIDRFLVELGNNCYSIEELNREIQWIYDALKTDKLEYTNYNIDDTLNLNVDGVLKNHRGYICSDILSVKAIDNNTFVDVMCTNSIINLLNTMCIPLPKNKDINQFFAEDEYYHNHNQLLYEIDGDVILLYYIDSYDYNNSCYCDVGCKLIANISVDFTNKSYKFDVKKGGLKTYQEHYELMCLLQKINNLFHSDDNITMG